MALLKTSVAATVVIGMFLVAPASLQGLARPLTEPQAKAAFLFNLPLFVEWPPDALPERAPLIVGLARATPVAAALRPVEGQLIRNRVLTVRQLRDGDDPRGVHILFVPQMDERATRLLLSRLEGAPLITVGEDERFIARGGMIRLYIRKAHLRIDVNNTRVEKAGLKISSKMLGLVNLVRGGDGFFTP